MAIVYLQPQTFRGMENSLSCLIFFRIDLVSRYFRSATIRDDLIRYVLFLLHCSYFDASLNFHNVFSNHEGNVANQREHLILLLANIHIRKANKQSILKLEDVVVDELMRKFFKNYTN
ncbi:putative callose synthase 8 [Humulus lupulus]|uniref:putative callose synthase 8 n=1 Tax=Humulus lupulus TaxID=3486 RepID=UPI002B404DC0|nr:putative callose synthase 8 [Humulus lupulus]